MLSEARLRRWGEVVVLPFLVLGAICVFLIMVLTTADVLARYALNAPVRGAYEGVQVLFAGLVFCGWPVATLRAQHISVALLSPYIPGAARRIVNVAFTLIIAVTFALIANRLWLLADGAARLQETMGAIEIPVALVYRAGALLAALAALLTLLVTVPLAAMSLEPSIATPAEGIE